MTSRRRGGQQVRAALIIAALVCAGGGLAGTASAQGFGDPAILPPPRPPGPAPREAAPVDLTGYWTAVVTEDYRLRMFVPAKYDYTGIPMSAAGREAAEQWDPERDAREGNACRAYGVGNLMRMPVRLHIEWEDDDTLRIESDHGRQTRLLHFDGPRFEAGGERTLQGDSVARWRDRTLEVVTRDMAMGYLRRNGVPYSGQTTVTEYFDQHTNDGQEWFTVTTIIEDPVYLRAPLYVSSDFRKLPDDADWAPSDCMSDWGPLRIMEDTDRFD